MEKPGKTPSIRVLRHWQDSLRDAGVLNKILHVSQVVEAEADTDVNVEVMRGPVLTAPICPSCQTPLVSRIK